jgi:hypothetical protein
MYNTFPRKIIKPYRQQYQTKTLAVAVVNYSLLIPYVEIPTYVGEPFPVAFTFLLIAVHSENS